MSEKTTTQHDKPAAANPQTSIEQPDSISPVAPVATFASLTVHRGGINRLTPTHILALQRTVGNQAVQRLLRGEPPPHSPAQPETQTPPAITHTTRAAVQPARYLMPFATFENRKHAVTTRKSMNRKRSTTDIKKIYKDYDSLVGKKKYVEARAELTKLDAKLTRMTAKAYWTNNVARDSLMNDMRAGMQQEIHWLTHEQGSRTGAPQQLGQAAVGITPMGQRPQANLTMGQGLVVDLGQMILFSDEFSSCSPIVMFNAGTCMGGLFHFPANNLEAQEGNLRAMYNQVQPTDIHLNDRNHPALTMMPQSHDLANLQNFFQNDIGFGGAMHVIPTIGNQYAVTLAAAGGGVFITSDVITTGADFDATHDRTGDERITKEQNWHNAPSTTKYGRDDWSRD